MEARVITKNIEIEGRRFIVKKYSAMDGLKVAKLLLAKVLPVFDEFLPLVKKMQAKSKPPIQLGKGGEEAAVTETESDGVDADVFAEVVDNFSLETISSALERLEDKDFDYIATKSLQNTSEILPAGEAPLMYANGTYGVENVKYDPILVLRLVCEAVMWSCGDFFDGNRLASVMKPLFNG